MIYIVTKFGYLFIYELTTVSFLARVKISNETIFIGAKNSKNDSIYAISKGGSLV